MNPYACTRKTEEEKGRATNVKKEGVGAEERGLRGEIGGVGENDIR